MEKITKKNFKKKLFNSKQKKSKKKLNPTRYGDWEKKEDVLIFNYFLFKRVSTKLSTTLGSARVETSPN